MEKIFVGVESRIFVFVLAMSSWISATKNLTKVFGVVRKSFWYFYSFVLASHTSID